MNRLILPAVSLLFGTVLYQVNAQAQPNTAPSAKATVLPFSVAEFEQHLGGRTLLTLDLKDATLEQVAAALSQASGQKIAARPPFVWPKNSSGVTPPAPPAPLFTLSATQAPFWETLRGWQLAARRASEAAALLSNRPSPQYSGNVPNSVGLQKSNGELLLQNDNNLADGRAVSAWPFLVVATDLRRTQEARISEEGLREIGTGSAPLARPLTTQTGAPVATTPKAPTTEEERWLDRLVLSTRVFIDPKIPVLGGLRCDVTEAVDEKGNDLRWVGGGTGNGGGSSPTVLFNPFETSAPLEINLLPKRDRGKRLVRLRGVLRFTTVTRSQHWETTELQTPADGILVQHGGEYKVQFKGLQKKVDGGWVANFAIESHGAHVEQMWKEFDANWKTGNPRPQFDTLDFGVSLVDDKGQAFEVGRGGLSSTLGPISPTGADAPPVISPEMSPVPPDAAQNWKYTGEKYTEFGLGSNSAFKQLTMGRPTKLIADFTLELREVSVPFEFTNLALPPQ